MPNVIPFIEDGGTKRLAEDGDALVTKEGTALGGGLHASDHTDGTDDIQDATSGQKGLATAAQIAKLDVLPGRRHRREDANGP